MAAIRFNLGALSYQWLARIERSNSPSRSLSFFKKTLDRQQKVRQVLSYEVPNDLVVDRVVAMRQNVSEGDDARCFADSVCCLWIGAPQPVECFTNDLEIALDSLAQKTILEVLGQIATPGCLENERCRVSDIFQVLGRIRTHKGVGASFRRSR